MKGLVMLISRLEGGQRGVRWGCRGSQCRADTPCPGLLSTARVLIPHLWGSHRQEGATQLPVSHGSPLGELRVVFVRSLSL